MPALWYVPDVRRVVELIVQAQYPRPSSFYDPPGAYPSYPQAGGIFNPQMGAVTDTTGDRSVRRRSLPQQVVFLAAALGLSLVYESASTLRHTGFGVTNGTVTSCDVQSPGATYSTYHCDVAWTDDNGQHSTSLWEGRYISPGATVPLAVRDGTASTGDGIRSNEELLAAGIGLLVVAVVVPVIGARRRRNSGV